MSDSTKQSILVIEDHADTQDIIRARLKKRGYIPIISSNATEGMEIARGREAISLILMDIELPGKNGIDATKELKLDPSTKSIPIIAVSANIDYRDKARLDDAGFDAYCLKPIDYDRLFRTITGFLRQKAS